MKTDTIIADGLAAMAEHGTDAIRKWAWQFKCVKDSACEPIEGSDWIDGFDGCLEKLAFKLRDGVKDCGPMALFEDYADMRAEGIIGSMYEYWALQATAEDWIVFSIAALEGE